MTLNGPGFTGLLVSYAPLPTSQYGMQNPLSAGAKP